MNLKVSVKYQLDEYKRPVIIFYIIVLLVCTVSLAAIMPADDSAAVKGRFGGMEIATIIFLFIAGMNSFRDAFRLFMQNSISRKTLFAGRLVCVSIVSSAMALIDTAVNLTGNMVLSSVSSAFIYQSLFTIIYGTGYNVQTANPQLAAGSLLFAVAFYLAASMFGYFITVLYYRLNKGGKIAVSVGVPAVVFVALPLVDAFVLNNTINEFFKSFSFLLSACRTA